MLAFHDVKDDQVKQNDIVTSIDYEGVVPIFFLHQRIIGFVHKSDLKNHKYMGCNFCGVL